MSIRQPMTMSTGISLLDVLPDAKPVNTADVLVHSACGQWNECQADDVFVAVVGSECDGHDFVNEAITRGATAVVGERLLAIPIPQFLVADSRLAYGKLCHALAGRPSKRMSTIGVAGSNGKTVTAHLVQSILQEAGANPGTASSIETRYGKFSLIPKTSDTAAAVADQLSSMALAECSHAIVEASSVSLAQHALAGTDLDVAVVTNLHSGNLAFHGSKGNVHRLTRRMLDYLKPSGFAVLNADDRPTAEVIDELGAPCLTFGIHQNAEVTAKILNRNRSCQTFMLSAGIESMPVRTTIIGKQHIYNCLAAATVGLAFGIELDAVVRGLETAVIPGRLERIDCGQPFGVWVDSAVNPSQISGAIAAVSPVCEGRLICIASTDSSQNQEERYRIGRIMERKADVSIVTQSTLSKQVDFEPCHQVLDGFENVSKAHVIPDRMTAIQWALSQANSDDCVLVAGAGEKPLAILGDDEAAICDRDICQAWLYDTAEITPAKNTQIFNIDDYRLQ